MASDVITGTTSNQYVICKLEWISVKNEVGNYSDVTATLKYSRTNSGYTTSGKWTGSITINGVKKEVSTANAIYITKNSNTVAMSSTVRVYHNSDGTKSITISATGEIPAANLKNTKCSGTAYLDEIDVKPPNFAGEPLIIENITQTSAEMSFSSNDTLDKIEYSIDGQLSWVEVNSKSFKVNNLIPNNNYIIYVRIRKKSNQKTAISWPWEFKTLPIYVTDIVVSDDIFVDVGKTVELNYSVLPENASVKDLNIISSNSNIISVNGNKITALDKGYVTLTLTSKDGGNVSKSISVSTVKRVEGIIINQTEIVLPKSSSLELKYTILPNDAGNKSVVLSSSDETIVFVEGNKITGVENGNATIKITTVDGGYSVEVLVLVFGDYVWYDFPVPLEVLNSIDIEHIKSNIMTIRSMLLLKGYQVQPLNDIYTDTNTPFNNIFDLLQNIEYNLDIISDNDAKSIYYVEPKTVGEYASNKQDIWRWLQVLQDMYNILNGNFGKWQILRTTDGYPIIEGKKIILRGDLIG